MNDSDPAKIVAGYLSDQLTAFEQRIYSANSPGSLDGLFAHYILHNTAGFSFRWDVSPIVPNWLEQNADGLTNAPQLAALGYGLTHFGGNSTNEFRTGLVAGLTRLMRRDPYPPDGMTFLHDPRQLIGIALATSAVHSELAEARGWLHRVVDDTRFRADTADRVLIREHVRRILSDEAPAVAYPTELHDVAHLALLHWMATAGTLRLPDPVVDLRTIQQRILDGLLSVRAADLSVPDAALMRAAAGQIIHSAIDGTILNRSHVGVVLRRFPAAMRRWRWDDPAKVKEPIRWPVFSEREVQDIVWMLLRAVFDELVDEEPLRKVGHSSYRSDFGLPLLGLLVEIKYVRAVADFKKIEKEVLEDSVAYRKDDSTYKKIVVFIYDASSSGQEHDTTRDALLGVEGIVDVVIVSRPSQLPPPGVEQIAPTGGPAKRRTTGKARTPERS